MCYWSKFQKRCFDLVIAALSLAVISPVLVLIALGIKILQKGPVFFRQMRPGYKGRPFKLVKFRTMKDLKDAGGVRMPDHMRLTGFGRWLRSTSMDELPELWNVLTGDMSLVGPRPLLMRYLPRYTPEQARRHDVRPGLTGWAQVNGRNAISWDEKFQLDVWYVDHQTFWLDLKIIVLTFKSILKREGISHSGEATMPEFTGNPNSCR